MQKSFWWWQNSDRYMISLFSHLHTPFPSFSPSLISLMVSVNAKCHVYLESIIYHLAQLQKAKLKNILQNVNINVLWMQFNDYKLLQIMSLLFSTLRLVKQSSIVIYILFVVYFAPMGPALCKAGAPCTSHSTHWHVQLACAGYHSPLTTGYKVSLCWKWLISLLTIKTNTAFLCQHNVFVSIPSFSWSLYFMAKLALSHGQLHRAQSYSFMLCAFLPEAEKRRVRVTHTQHFTQ